MVPKIPRLRILLGIVLLLEAPHSAAQAAREWPQWRGVDRAGIWEGVKLPPRLDAGAIRVRWKEPIGPGYSGIAVALGKVYTLDSPRKGRERVVCLDGAEGKTLWTHEHDVEYGDMDYATGPRSTPTVEAGRVFTIGAVGHIHCLEADTGKVVWSVDTVATHSAKLPQWGHAASPLVHGNLVLFQVGGRPGGTLMAFEKATGKESWRALEDRPSYSSPIVLSASGRVQVVFWTADSVTGLEPLTGEVLWRVPYKSTYDVAIASPVHADGIVLVSGYWEGANAFRLDGGAAPRTIWEGKSLSCLMSTPLYRGGHAYALDKDQGLQCIEWPTGKVLWKDGHRVTPKARNPQASMVWAGEKVVILNELGELILARLTPGGYEDLGRAPVIGKTWAHPAFAGQDVYARSDSEIVCVRIEG